MKNKRTLTIAAIIAALAIIISFGIFRSTNPVKAQDQIPPPVPERISFGMVGITSGQTVRVSVSNTIMPNDANLPPGPTRVVLNFRLPNGQLLRNRSGEVIRKAVDLERGDSTFLDVDFGATPPPIGDRLQLRAVIVATPPPIGDSNQLPPPVGDRIASTVEVINNRDGRTQFVVFTNPAVIRGFNPQPDPPLGQ
jgi:hypothetical protein